MQTHDEILLQTHAKHTGVQMQTKLHTFGIEIPGDISETKTPI
jgi:hypothetical protein